VAVLPFLCIGAAPEQEVFAEGMTEDVIAHLTKVRGLNVISRASVTLFKDRHGALTAIASRLGATAVLDGSVRFAGSRVRIVVTLVDVVAGHDLWAETYDRELTDIFAIQSEVALRIAEALRGKLTGDEGDRMHSPPTADLQAYGLYLQARRHFLLYTYDGMRRAAALFQAAVDRDPNFAHALTLLAMTSTHRGTRR
jgi:adenylate cyclase